MTARVESGVNEIGNALFKYVDNCWKVQKRFKINVQVNAFISSSIHGCLASRVNYLPPGVKSGYKKTPWYR